MEGIFSTKTVSDTNWHHVAVTKAGSKAAFYLDGLPASDELKYEATFYFDSPAAIGSRGDGRGGTFWGMIDELAIYRRPLSATEIQTIYKANVAAIYLPEFRPFVPPASGLVNWWPGDGDVRDICGRTNGILMNGTKFAAGKVGKAFRFDGRTQCVKFPRTASLDVGEQLSIACWMKADPDNFMSNIQGLVITDFYGISISSGFDFTKYGVNFGLNTDPTKLLSSETCPTTADANEGAAVVTPGQWHHIAGTYDGCRLQLYVDGRPWGKPVKHSGRISPMTTNSFLTIGSEDGKGIPGYKARYFKGLIDEVCIYNRALTADEIEYFYKAGCAGIPVFQNIR
jgi:hypothetical protein